MGRVTLFMVLAVACVSAAVAVRGASGALISPPRVRCCFLQPAVMSYVRRPTRHLAHIGRHWQGPGLRHPYRGRSPRDYCGVAGAPVLLQRSSPLRVLQARTAHPTHSSDKSLLQSRRLHEAWELKVRHGDWRGYGGPAAAPQVSTRRTASARAVVRWPACCSCLRCAPAALLQ